MALLPSNICSSWGWGMCPPSTSLFLKWPPFLIELFIEMTVDSHAVLENNTESACVPFTHFPSMMTCYKTLV